MLNVFLLGLDAFNARELASIRGADGMRFHRLLTHEKVVRPRGVADFDALLERAAAELDAFPGRVDAVASYWDFPSNAIAGVMRNARGLPGPTDAAICKCEHKIWSRIEQRAAVPAMVPGFAAFDPFAADPLAQIGLDFPFWVKPVKAHSSHLGFRIRDRAAFERHLPSTHPVSRTGATTNSGRPTGRAPRPTGRPGRGRRRCATTSRRRSTPGCARRSGPSSPGARPRSRRRPDRPPPPPGPHERGRGPRPPTGSRQFRLTSPRAFGHLKAVSVPIREAPVRTKREHGAAPAGSIRGCPRNCERRALLHQCHWPRRGREGGARATTREPGDLPTPSPIRGAGRAFGADPPQR